MLLKDADIYTWGLTDPEIGSGMHYPNVRRCWAMKRCSGASDWDSKEVKEGVDSFGKVLLKEQMYKPYISRWNSRSMDAARAGAKAEYKRLIKEWYLAMVPCVPNVERVPKQFFDTISMLYLWFYLNDDDVAVTLTYFYRPNGVFASPDFCLTKDMDGKELQHLRDYYQSFFPGDNGFQWWRNNDHHRGIVHRPGAKEVLKRLKELPWLVSYVDERGFAGKESGQKIFRSWMVKAKEWAAERDAAQAAAAQSGYRF